MSGLLYLDLFDSEWNKITTSNGLYDSAIWDILEFENSIYLATANGLNEVMDGLALLNRDTAYQFGVGGTRTGSATTRNNALVSTFPPYMR